MPSVFGITGSEDLGAGMKASFNLESDINADTGALSAASGGKLFGRKSNVALSGNFGELKLGKDIDQIFLQGFIDNIRNSHSASGFMAHALGDYAFYANVAGELDYVNQQSVFTQNMVRYTTPTFNGFKAAVQHSFGEIAGATRQNKATGFLANYAVAGATFAAGTKKVTDVQAATWGTGYDTKLTYLGATYTTGPFKLAATYHKSVWKNDGTTELTIKTREVGAAYTINPKLVAALNYVEQKLDSDTKSNIKSASLKYSLSKRTNLWTLVSRTGKDSLALGANYANADQTAGPASSYSVGVTHSF
jgi:predicted porin